jgi:hypothetical protein
MLGKPAHIGKEGNLLEERVRGEVLDERDYLDEYEDSEWNDFETVVTPALLLLSSRRLAEVSGLDRTTVKRIRSGRSTGTLGSRRRLIEAAAVLAGEDLRRLNVTAPNDPLVCLTVFVEANVAGGAIPGAGVPGRT